MAEATMPAPPHPDSIIQAPSGRLVPLKVHRCRWSGTYPENSLPAIEECYRKGVARAEIDLHMLRDTDFLVLHDSTLDSSTTGTGLTASLSCNESQALRLRWNGRISPDRPPLFSEVVALIRDLPSPPLLELDYVPLEMLPWPRAEELVRLIEPVRDRVLLNGCDWNVRRLLEIDPYLPVAYDLYLYLDWVPRRSPDEAELRKYGLKRRAYGYLDTCPVHRNSFMTAAEYLTDRLTNYTGLVRGARELHIRLATFERMLDDGISAADFVHRQGMLLDVWTLNVDTLGWRERLARSLATGVDVITTDTPRAIAATVRESA